MVNTPTSSILTEEGVVRYLADINMEIIRHDDAEPGELTILHGQISARPFGIRPVSGSKLNVEAAVFLYLLNNTRNRKNKPPVHI